MSLNGQKIKRMSIKHLIEQNKNSEKITNYKKLLRNSKLGTETYIYDENKKVYGIADLYKTEGKVIIFLGSVDCENYIIYSEKFNENYKIIENYNESMK